MPNKFQILEDTHPGIKWLKYVTDKEDEKALSGDKPFSN